MKITKKLLTDLILESLEEELLKEKLMLKKGRNGWWKYSQLVAQAYRDAPESDAAAVKGYEVLAEWLHKHFNRLQGVTEFKFVPEHVYTSAKDLQSRVAAEGVMYVSTLDADHPVWTGKKGLITNTMFRAWHDWEGHIVKGKGFSLQGEIAAYNAHAKIVPREALGVLFTEVVGQICCFYQSGKKNCEQKAAILPGFDYINVGVVEGYDIVNKELVKKGEQLQEEARNFSQVKPWESGIVFFDKNAGAPPIPPRMVRIKATVDTAATTALKKNYQKNNIVLQVMKDTIDPKGNYSAQPVYINVSGKFAEPDEEGRFWDVDSWILRKHGLTDKYSNLLDSQGNILATKKQQNKFSGA